MPRDTKITPEQIETAKKLRARGMSYKAIAQQLQVKWQTLYDRLNSGKSSIPSPELEQRIIEMLELRKQGLRNDEIARELGVTHESVRHTLSRKRLERYGFIYVPSPHFKTGVT